MRFPYVRVAGFAKIKIAPAFPPARSPSRLVRSISTARSGFSFLGVRGLFALCFKLSELLGGKNSIGLFGNVLLLSFVRPAFTHSACHASIFAFWSGVRLSVRQIYAIEFECEAPLGQHALSPAKALDAISIAAPTKTVVVILIMVKC